MEKLEFVACARAAAFGLSCLDEGGEFDRGRARSPVYYERMKLALKKVLLRTWNGSGEENVEPHTHISTIRGLAQILGVTPKSAWKYLKTFERYSLIEMCGLKFRRGELHVEGEPLMDHPLWWMPFRWRIGPALLDFFTELLGDGTGLAVSPAENQYSPCVPPTSGGSNLTVQPDSGHVSQKVQNYSWDVATFDFSVKAPAPIDAVDKDEVLAQAQAAIQGMRLELPPENPVHPHGRDIGYLMSGCATPAVVGRVARYMGTDFRALVRYHRKAAKIRKAEIPIIEVTSVEELPASRISDLERACRTFEHLPPRRERPVVPQIPRRQRPIVPQVPRRKPSAVMPHPIGHNGPPVSETPAEGDAYDQIMAKYGIPPRPKNPS